MTHSNASGRVVRKPARRGALSDLLARPPSARLSLDPTLGRRGAVDGGWWPRSRDATAELPALVTALDARLGTTSRRVSLHVDAWDNIPRRLPLGGRVVRVDWYRSMDTHGLSVTADHGSPIQLLVVPAGTAPTPAGIALAMAASGKDAARPTDILAASAAAARARDPQHGDQDSEEVWENEGGRISARAPKPAQEAPAISLRTDALSGS